LVIDRTTFVSVDSPTEQRNLSTTRIDELGIREVVSLLLAEESLVPAAVARQTDAIAAAADLMVQAISAGKRVHYVGAGTSGRLCMLDVVELLPTYSVGPEWIDAHMAGGRNAVFRASENSEDDRQGADADLDDVRENDVVVGVAASGRTPYVAGAFERARRVGARTVLVSANPQSPFASDVDVPIIVETGPEAITGSTRMKAATAQKVVLNTLSTTTMVRLGRTYSNLMSHMSVSNGKLRGRMVNLLMQAGGSSEDICSDIVLAADYDLPVALTMLLADVSADRAREALAEACSVRQAVRVLAEQR